MIALTTWTNIDADGSVYIYVRGRLVAKTWTDGNVTLFQAAPRQSVRVPRTYASVEVRLSGKLLSETPPASVDWKWCSR